MQATFGNKFKVIEMRDEKPRIQYRPEINCNLNVFIDRAKPATPEPGEKPAVKDWEITIEGGNDIIIKEYKLPLINELSSYLVKRTKRAPLHLKFTDIVYLAKMKDVS